MGDWAMAWFSHQGKRIRRLRLGNNIIFYQGKKKQFYVNEEQGKNENALGIRNDPGGFGWRDAERPLFVEANFFYPPSFDQPFFFYSGTPASPLTSLKGALSSLRMGGFTLRKVGLKISRRRMRSSQSRLILSQLGEQLKKINMMHYLGKKLL